MPLHNPLPEGEGGIGRRGINDNGKNYNKINFKKEAEMETM